MKLQTSTLLAARIHPWQAFKIRKISEERGQRLGLILSEAIQIYTSLQFSKEKLDEWLREYHEIHKVESS